LKQGLPGGGFPANRRETGVPGLRKISCIIFLGISFLIACSPANAEQGVESIDYKELISEISAYKGKVVVVNFWATWCPPCRLEIPHLVRLRKEYDPEEMLVIGVSMDENKAAVRDFLQENSLNYPVFWGEGSVGQFFQVSGLPTTLVYDRDKVKVFAHVGYMDEEKLREVIQNHLK
jgi:thiol-disulfide isomerase/thioredoxin